MTSQARQQAPTELYDPPHRIDIGDLHAHAGQHLGFGPWHEILQEDVTLYAVLTGDEQWIHVDPERAAAGPFGATVAHGFFTLARFTGLLREILAVDGVRTTLNYGLNRVRFPAPARVGVRLRMGVGIDTVEELPDSVQVVYGATFETEGQPKPVCVAQVVFRYYPSGLTYQPTANYSLQQARGGTMADPNDPTQEIQAQILDGIRKSQEAVIDGMRSWTETVQQLVPGTGQAAWPGREQLPSPAEVVDSVFDFAAQLLNAQRELAHSVLGAATAVGDKVQEQAEQAAGTAKKPTSKRG